MATAKILIAFSMLIIIGSACKKDKAQSAGSTDQDDCITSGSIGSGNIIDGKYIVSYKSTIANAGKMSAARLNEFGRGLLKKNNISDDALEANFSGAAGGFIAHLSKDEAVRLIADENIGIVEPDKIIALGTCFTVVEPRLVTWNITRVGFGDGTGKTAWVIDTGIDFDHPDLLVDKSRSKSFLINNTSADDENGHGTHVAGIIGAKNNNFGVLGVASGATLVSLRVLDKDGEGTLSSIVKALSYVNENASPGDVVNMSVGEDEGVSPTLDQQVQNTAARGIYIAIAAGNEHELASLHSPGRANAANIFTVSAIDSLDNFASFSNYGNDAVDYAMPGVRILSTYINGKYAYMSGTSMAAPHMAGLLLLKGKNITTSGMAKNDPDGMGDAVAHY